jgi:hypothetical protein
MSLKRYLVGSFILQAEKSLKVLDQGFDVIVELY